MGGRLKFHTGINKKRKTLKILFSKTETTKGAQCLIKNILTKNEKKTSKILIYSLLRCLDILYFIL